MASSVIEDSAFTESFIPVSLRLAAAGVERPGTECAALLWLDIVESSRIGRRLVEAGPTGIETLAAILNAHFDQLITTIVEHGGEPLMFAGDSVLAGWRCEPHAVTESVLRSIACAEAVLGAPAVALPWGERIALHVAVAAGPCCSSEVGRGADKLFVTVGRGLVDLQATVAHRAPGQILLSNGARDVLGPLVRIAPAGPTASILVESPHRTEKRPLVIPSLTETEREQLVNFVPLPILGLNRELVEWAVELRQLTVIFGRIAELDDETSDILERLEGVVDIAGPIVRDNGGFLHQMSVDDHGTQFRIYFGTPASVHADSPVRAVRTAMALRDALRTRGYRISMGVATGQALTGLLGNDLFRSYEVFGGILSRAARLQGLQQGMVQCDGATAQAGRGRIEFVPIGQSVLRGISSAADVWAPRREARPESRVQMCGRAKELGTLQELLAAAQAGRTGAVVIEAESGMGKSHLLAEFRQHAAEAGCLVVSGEADPIERRVPFRAWRGVVAGLLERDAGPGEARPRVEISPLGPGLDQYASLLNAVLPLDLPETAATRSLAPTQRVTMLSELLLALLRQSARDRAMLVTIDDAHWAGEETWQLAAAALQVPGLCLVLAMQPMEDDGQFAPLEAGGALRLRLEPLGESDQACLALERLGADRMSPELASLLQARAGGHPFFCLELAQVLLDEQLVEIVDGTARLSRDAELSALPLPATLRSAVIRRIDRLKPESQITLKVASATGLRFPTRLVVDVHPTMPHALATVGSHLALHHRIGLLTPEQVGEREGYAFHHGAMRDIAYDLMLYAQRRMLHREIAAWYERETPNARERIYALLAHHLEAAGEEAGAARYLQLEAERLFSQGFARQSVAVGLHAAELLGLMLSDDEASLQAAIATEMEAITQRTAGRDLAALVQLPALDNGRVEQLIGLLLSLAPFAHQCEKLLLFALFGCTCLRLTLEHGNGLLAPDVYSMYSVVYGALTGDRVTAAAWSRLGLELLGSQRGAQFARCGFIQAWFHNHWTAPFEHGVDFALESAEAGLSENEVLFSCFSLSAHVVLLASGGAHLETVISTAQAYMQRNARQVVNAYHHLVQELQFAKAMSGATDGLLALGDADIPESDIEAVLATGFTNQIGYYFIVKTRLHVYAADWEQALAWSDRALTLRQFFAGQPGEFELVQYRGLAALARVALGGGDDWGLLEEARDCIETLRGWEQRNPALFAHKADLLEGMLRASEGNFAAAGTLLRRARMGAGSGSFRNDVALISECLARCWRRAGAEADAQEEATLARSLYVGWGAHRKAEALAGEFGLRRA